MKDCCHGEGTNVPVNAQKCHYFKNVGHLKKNGLNRIKQEKSRTNKNQGNNTDKCGY